MNHDLRLLFWAAVCLPLSRVHAQAGPWSERVLDADAPASDEADVLDRCDLDGDGDTDVCAGVAWYENLDGAGGAWERHSMPTSFRTFDLDGDGDEDLLSRSTGIDWNENLGDGTSFVRHVIFDGPALFTPVGIDAADLDQDGDADLVSADSVRGVVLWHENVAGNAATWRNRVVGFHDLVTSLALADVDGDGDIDALAGKRDVSPGDGSGYSWFENRLAAGLGWAKHAILGAEVVERRIVRAADVDADGDVDAVVASSGASSPLAVGWIENDLGAPEPAEPWVRHLLVFQAAPSSVQAYLTQPVDLDRDGDVDLLRASSVGVGWSENSDGVGGAWRDRAVFLNAHENMAGFADVDSDGDIDVLGRHRVPAGGSGELRVSWHVNETPLSPYGRDVNPRASLRATTGALTVGRAFELALDNPLATQAAGSLTLLWVSAAPAPGFPAGALLPGFGMSGPGADGELLIDLSGVLARFSGPPWGGPGLPATIAAEVPDDPGLAGITVFLQGILIDPAATLGVRYGLTNALRATILP